MLPQITAVGTLNKLETKFTPSGKEVTKFTLECSEKNAKGEWENLYLNGEVWEKASTFLNQYFKDGSVAIVTGKLVTNVYEKQDGSKVYENKLLFPSVSFVPKDKADNQGQTSSKNQEPDYRGNGYNENVPKKEHLYPEINIDEDEIPFSQG